MTGGDNARLASTLQIKEGWEVRVLALRFRPDR
mgnify:CR=1 FL=1